MDFQRDVTRNVEPVSPNPQATIAANTATAKAIDTAIGAVETGIKDRAQWDINKAVADIEATREAFLRSNISADLAGKDIPATQQRITSLMEVNKTLFDPMSLASIQDTQGMNDLVSGAEANLGAIKGFREDLARLQAASQSGMTNMEYTTRVSAITKAAIAQYPGLGDKIRQEVSKVTGLGAADDFAAAAFVKQRFSASTKEDLGTKLQDDMIKDIATNGGFLIGNVLKAYQQNSVEFAEMSAIAASNKQINAARDAIKARQEQTTMVGNRAAREQIPLIETMAAYNAASAVLAIQQQYMREGTDIGTLLAKVKDDPAAQQALMKGNAARLTAVLNKSQEQAHADLTARLARDGMAADESVVKELRTAIDNKYKWLKENMGSDAGVLGMLSALNEHRDKTIEQQMRIMTANTQYLQIWMNNDLFKEWIQGGASRKSVEERHPDIARTLTRMMQEHTGMLESTAGLARGAQAVTLAATADRASRTDPAAPIPTSREGHAGVGAAYVDTMRKYEGARMFTPETVAAVTNVMKGSMEGANYLTISKDYDKIAKFLAEAGPEARATFNKNVAEHYPSKLDASRMKWESYNVKDDVLVINEDGSIGKIPFAALGKEKKERGFLDELGTLFGMDAPTYDYHVTNYIEPLIIAGARVRSLVTGETLKQAKEAIVNDFNTGVITPLEIPTSSKPSTRRDAATIAADLRTLMGE